MNTDPVRELQRQACATSHLLMQGWTPLGNWKFRSPKGSTHDLSAADLGQLQHIQAEGLFLA